MSDLMYRDLSVCSVEYEVNEDSPEVLLFCRDRGGEPYTIRVPHEPYFYILKKDAHLFSSLPVVKRIEGSDFISPNKESLMKVVVGKPTDVPLVRNKVKTTVFEGDILFPDRFMIDRNIYTGIRVYEDEKIEPKDMPSNFRILYLDIETFSKKSPNSETDPVIVIGFYDNMTKTYTIISQTDSIYDKLQTFLINPKYRVNYVRTLGEKELLDRFIKCVQGITPDLILTFSAFDMTYLIDRMKKLKLRNWRDLSRVGIVQSRGEEYKIHGIQVLDIQEMYSLVLLEESKWGTLEDICQKELGYGRLYHLEQVSDLWSKDKEKVLARNIRDVELTRLLTEKDFLLESIDTIRRTIGSNFSASMRRSNIADMLYLRLCKGEKTALPSKSFKEKEEYEGGIVLDIKPGIYKNVVVFDWKGMYPSIIKAFNISYNTFTSPELGGEYFNIDDKFHFVKSPIGWTVKLINTLEPLREVHRRNSRDPNLTDDQRNLEQKMSDSYKSIVNALYGLYGKAADEKRKSKSSRLYHSKIAAAITYVGRTLQKEGIIPLTKELGLNLIYMDTDSVMIGVDDVSDENVKKIQKELGKRAKEFVEERWKGQSEYFTLDLDNIYETMIFFAKKRYIAKSHRDKKTKVKGLEIIRKNVAEISVDVQNKISEMIFNGEPKENIVSYIKDITKSFRNLPLEKIGIALKLTKEIKKYSVLSGHLKAFLYSTNVLKMDLEEGKRFYTVYVKLKKTPLQDKLKVTGIEKEFKVDSVAWDQTNPLPANIQQYIDWDKMLDKTVKEKVDDFLGILELDWKKDILNIPLGGLV